MLLLMGIVTLAFNISPAKAWTGTVYIRDDGSIQPQGAPITTYDNVTYTLTDDITSSGSGIVVERDNIIIDGAGYTVQGEGDGTGIELIERSNVRVKNIIIKGFGYGIWLEGSSDNIIIENTLEGNREHGIEIWWGSSGNSIIGNNITYNSFAGVNIGGDSGDNLFYHNNFIGNAKHVQASDSENVWDNGYPCGGNYWSDYSGTDLHWGSGQTETGSDGIGDTAHQIDADNIDRYPLMGPFSTFNAGTWDGTSFNVDVISNSTVSGFQFNVDQKSVSFNVTGDEGTTGFCRVTIPNDLLWVDDGWTIIVGDQQITDYRIISHGGFTYIYFTYNHSTKAVTIQGTHVIPEFQPAIIMPLFMILTMLPIIFTKKKAARRQKT